jgi:hypothetical protein
MKQMPDQPHEQNDHTHEKQQDGNAVHAVHHFQVSGVRRIGIFFPDKKVLQYLVPDLFHIAQRYDNPESIEVNPVMCFIFKLKD